MSNSQRIDPNTETYKFGEFILSPDAGLSKAGKRIAVAPKELGLLELLLSKQGRIATHREIEQQLWPRQSVSYLSLARCVHSLRKSLGDDTHSLVVTTPKRGYSIGVPVIQSNTGYLLSVTEKTARAEARAYSEYIEGVREANRAGPDSQQRAIDLFENSHRIDPSYAVPLSAIADCWMYAAIRGYTLPADALREGLNACARALSVDNTLASAYAARGWFKGVIQRNPEAALSDIDRADSIDPEYARSQAYRAWVLRGACDLCGCIRSARRSTELDPHSLLNRHLLAWNLFCSGEVEQALAMERSERREYPHIDLGHAYVAIMAAELGLYDEAIEAARQAAEVSHDNPTIMTALSYVCAVTGDTARARQFAADLAARRMPRAARPQLAMTFVALGDFDAALGLLREARSENCLWFLSAQADPRIGPLKRDSRFHKLYA